MGYVERATGIPDFSKGVISIWFHIPAAAVTAKTAEFTAWAMGDGIDGDLIGVIPLLTFGPNTETAFFSGTAETGDLSPCVVGVLCDDGGPHLYFRAQYSTGAAGYPIDYNDFFQVGGKVGTSFAPAGTDPTVLIPVTADARHHVLISFDFSGGCATTGNPSDPVTMVTTCPFYWALDDVNYTADYLGPNTPSLFGQSPVAGIVSDMSTICDTGGGGIFPPSYSFAAGDIATNGKPIAFPASSDRTDHHVFKVRESDAKIYTGVTLDTSVTANRRAFITEGIAPASPALAAALLGKDPEVHFQTLNDWITGNNRGTAGLFDPTGTINAYTPP